MRKFIGDIKDKIYKGLDITKDEAMALWREDTEELAIAADEIRRRMCGNGFDLCAIINGKSGRCSEDCKFCPQSCHHNAAIKEYPLLREEEILADALKRRQEGIKRYSVVTSGSRLRKEEVAAIARCYRQIKETTSLRLCGSFGLLTEEDYRILKKAGMERCHNNLETSRSFFPKICSTHSYDEKIAAIKAAKKAGMSLCSGGIIGLGEAPEDRIDMALTLRELKVSSVPINVLNAIAGTPLEAQPPLNYDEIRRTVAVFRFILPEASLRLSGGRGLLADKGEALLKAGANAAISGDMLTTAGISTEQDLILLEGLGYEVKCDD
ncbi:MAG: biotin synthase BioB [Bacillota bacterium]|nr:biotin synthase BioB [Bacillota bacterium]